MMFVLRYRSPDDELLVACMKGAVLASGLAGMFGSGQPSSALYRTPNQ